MSWPNLNQKLFIPPESKNQNSGWRGNPPFLIPALWNIGILLHKKATLGKHFEPECIFWDYHTFKENEGDFVYTSDSEAIAFENWAPSQPDDNTGTVYRLDSQ